MYAEMLFIDFRAVFLLSSYPRLDLKQIVADITTNLLCLDM